MRRGTPAGTPFAELPAVAFPRRGFSATETLLAINLLVALILASLWRAEYPERIFEVAGLFHRWFREQLIPVGFVTTLFMHAGLQHVVANMVAMVPASAFVEYLFAGACCWSTWAQVSPARSSPTRPRTARR